MTMQTAELAVRVEALERHNRWLRRVGAVGLALVGVALVMGRVPSTPAVVEAEKFVVRDRRGEERIVLGLDHPTSPNHSPVRIALYNAEQKSSAVLYLSDGLQPERYSDRLLANVSYLWSRAGSLPSRVLCSGWRADAYRLPRRVA
jgi:hypothetical protein